MGSLTKGQTQSFDPLVAPDQFYDVHRQAFGQLRDWLYRHIVRHWMNARVRRIRDGRLPLKPGTARLNHRHEGDVHAT